MNKKLKELEKARKPIIKELNKLEKKFGAEIFRSACVRKIAIDRATKKAQDTIQSKLKEIEQLKKGKIKLY